MELFCQPIAIGHPENWSSVIGFSLFKYVDHFTVSTVKDITSIPQFRILQNFAVYKTIQHYHLLNNARIKTITLAHLAGVWMESGAGCAVISILGHKKLLDTHICNHFIVADKLNTLGHSCKLIKQHSTMDATKIYFSNHIVSIWNSLSEDVVSAPSVTGFKIDCCSSQ